MKTNLNFRILSFANDKFSPHSVERLLDNGTKYDETFSIGDHVTNGTRMNGKIERFDLSEDLQSLYVYTDWSGVGMNLESIYKVEKLPSPYQINDEVILKIPGAGSLTNCKILNVHFSLKQVRYDLSVEFKADETDKIQTTRLYNVDDKFVFSLVGLLNRAIFCTNQGYEVVSYFDTEPIGGQDYSCKCVDITTEDRKEKIILVNKKSIL